MEQQNRQLAAILFTDIVGYTAMMQQDEHNAVAVTRHYITVLKLSVAEHHGKILNDYGDGSLCSFSSASEAVRCAIEMQRQLQMDPKVPLRIGLHIGELFFEGEKVMGDGVNIASRIQSLGQPNTILFSKEVFDKLKNQAEFKSVSVGKFQFKNVDEPMEVFALVNEDLVVPERKRMGGKLQAKKSSRKKWLVSAVIIFLLAAGFLIYKNFSSGAYFKGDKSIAVLPFENVGIDNSEEYISDGITRYIINNLSQISNLQKVIGWFSVRSFKKTTKTLKQIADELGVAAILLGTIQKHGAKTHIIAELIEVSTNKQLWGDDFEYQSEEIFSIQSRVETGIVTALQLKVSEVDKKKLSKNGTENVEAYKFYLKGRNYWYASSPENNDSAEANYQRAIQLEPNYALAYAGLADCHIFNYKGLSQLDEMPIAKYYAGKALSIDSTLSEALKTTGFIQQNFEYNWAEARKNLGKAVDVDPNNSAAHSYYGLALMHSTNDKAGALREMKKAVELDPLSYIPNWILARNYYFAGKYDLAIDQFNKMSLSIPKTQQYVPIFSLGLIYLKQHLYSRAKEAFEQLPQGNEKQLDNYQVLQSYAYAVMGDKARAEILLEKTIKKYPNLSSYRNSQVYVALGNFDEAMNQLERGYDYRDTHMFWIGVDPAFDPIRNDPRFKALLKKMNLD